MVLHVEDRACLESNCNLRIMSKLGAVLNITL